MNADSAPTAPRDQQAILLATLIARFEQREERMRAGADQFQARMANEVMQARRQVEQLVELAGERIGRDTERVLGPALDRQVAGLAVSTDAMRSAAHAARFACITLAATLAASALLAWGVLSHYRGQLSDLRDDLQQHRQAEAILRAYAASDVRLCGQVLCANVDPTDAGGDDRYRVVRERPAERPSRPE